MMYEEKKEIRKQISQMLADAGLNQGTIKEMIELEIKNKVDRAVDQVIANLDKQSSGGNYILERLNVYLRNHYINNRAFEDVIKNELKDKVVQIVLKDVSVVEE